MTHTQAQIAAILADYLGPVQSQAAAARITALTAAAEAGEPYICALQTGKSGKRCIGWDNAIERCAQVAETTPALGYGKEPGEVIAAAIRAMKEEP